MDKQLLLKRIACDHRVMAGKPVVKGTRLTVEFLLGLLAQSSSMKDVLDEYDGLTQEDIQACLLFASHSLGNTAFMPLAESV